MMLLVIAAHLLALADEDRVRIVFFRDTGAEACPTNDEIEELVRTRVGSEPFRDDDEGPVMRVGIRSVGPGLEGRIAVFARDGTKLGQRVIRGAADCHGLAGDLVLAIAKWMLMRLAKKRGE